MGDSTFLWFISFGKAKEINTLKHLKTEAKPQEK